MPPYKKNVHAQGKEYFVCWLQDQSFDVEKATICGFSFSHKLLLLFFHKRNFYSDKKLVSPKKESDIS